MKQYETEFFTYTFVTFWLSVELDCLKSQTIL